MDDQETIDAMHSITGEMYNEIKAIELGNELGKTLPPVLLEFFRRFPPSDSYATGPQRPARLTGNPKPTEILLACTPLADPTYNPFQTWKNPITGRWRPPMFSLRRQAELVKKAVNYGVAELLPHTNKLPWVKAQKREEQGLRVKGTGVGEKVKGKAWERTVKGRLEKRRRAMLEMPKLVQQWKQRGHGRGWKKWPK
ncbi:hypothetical protein E6O75_ATG00164 [Venturia nashicola]|uniref:Large ribosomal subunit protein mL59 domain-containing protein n=1 Tax=Venturia nashicola TaxID=86259 RepID=A0A4Z1PHS4_9PEZI|nr:hypothetical protein E6O75_ATG00164 [Venturia nashicola]